MTASELNETINTRNLEVLSKLRDPVTADDMLKLLNLAALYGVGLGSNIATSMAIGSLLAKRAALTSKAV